MKAVKTDRGFIFIEHPRYLTPREDMRMIGESSAIGDYEDSVDKPGSSFLWFGDEHHLNREEVAELIERMQYWLKNGNLEKPDDE